MYKEIERNKRITWLVMIVFVFFMLILGYFYGLLSDIGYLGIILALVFTIPSVLIGYYGSDKAVLFMAGAKLIEKRDNPILYNLVENLSIASGMKTPQIFIIEDPAMNAFATGRDPEHAVVAVTTGLLGSLEKKELEGVIAHEMSHIKNYDTRLGTLVVIFVGLVAVLADFFWRFGGRRRNSKEGGGILALIGIAFIILSPIVAKLLQLSLSRNREYLADSEGALLTRYPEGLASALEKISGQKYMLQKTNNAMNHLFIISPFESLEGEKRVSWFSNLFSTHPPTDERIKRLRHMAR